MKKHIFLLVGLIAVFLACGCKNNSKPSIKSVTEEALTPNDHFRPDDSTKSSSNSEGGGLDSSGGETIKSTNEQVTETLKDINIKVYNALSRLTIDTTDERRVGFDKTYGQGNYDLFQRLSKGNNYEHPPVLKSLKLGNIEFTINKEQPCIGDGNNKAGSATGKNGNGSICLSVTELMKVAPEALATEAIALGIHEVGHLYGLNEEEAISLQKIFTSNPLITAPSEKNYRFAESLFASFRSSIAHVDQAIGLSYEDGVICTSLVEARAKLQSIIEFFAPGEDAIPFSNKVTGLLFFPDYYMDMAVGFCGMERFSPAHGGLGYKPVEKGNRGELLLLLSELYPPVLNAQATVMMSEDYFNEPRLLMGDFLNMSLRLDMLIHPLMMEARRNDGQDVGGLLNPEINISCHAGTVDVKDGKVDIQPHNIVSRPRKIYENEKGKLYVIETSNGLQMMVRTRYQTNEGVFLAITEKGIKNADVDSGYVAFEMESGREKTDVYPSTIIARGVNESATFTFQMPNSKDIGVVRCVYGEQPLEAKNIPITDPPLLPFMLNQIINAPEDIEEDETISGKGYGILKLYGGEWNSEQDIFTQGELKVEAKITTIEYTPYLIIETELEGVNCTFPDKRAQEFNLQLKPIVQRLMTPNNITVSCWKNGEPEAQPQQMSAWAFDIMIEEPGKPQIGPHTK